MSIVTRTGDGGETRLMYGRVVSKRDARVEACGAVDELNAALGLARAAARDGDSLLHGWLESVQKDLFVLMGGLATVPEDAERLKGDGFALFGAEYVGRLDGLVAELEGSGVAMRGWALPGGNGFSAALDFARAVCRRAERAVCGLEKGGLLEKPEEVRYLNRLSDLLWLMARKGES
jgi:cob(I)alamin adenosyltransferase